MNKKQGMDAKKISKFAEGENQKKSAKPKIR